MKARKIISMVLLVTFVLSMSLFAGCGSKNAEKTEPAQAEQPAKKEETAKKEEPAKKEDKPIVIGISLLTLEHQFFQDMKASMEKIAAEKGVKVKIVAGEFDANKQATQIDDFIMSKVDAIILAPCDSKAVAPSVEKADKAGIPVFTVDIAAEGAPVKTHVASDNLMGGKLAGKLMGEALKDKSGTVVIIDHPAITSVQDRTKGFEESIKELCPNIKIERVLGEGKRDKAMAAAEDALQKFGDNLVGIFGINDDSALGALSAVERANKVGKIVIVGYDAVPQAQEAIKTGKMLGDTVQFPKKIGQIGLETAIKYVKGEDKNPPAKIPVEVGTFTKDGYKDKDGNVINP